MTVFDRFDLILADFNKVEERVFLRQIREFAELHRDVVIKTFTLLLKNQDLNIQLKFLVLRSIGELNYKEFIPVLQGVLTQSIKVQILYEALNSLSIMSSLPAYKVIVDFFQQTAEPEIQSKIEKMLREIFSRNHLIFHFDVFYRNRGGVPNIEKSSEFLIKNLPEENIKDLLPALNSHFYPIRFELLRLLKHRPNPLFYANIFYYFKENHKKVDEAMFLILSEALMANAVQSRARSKIFQKLKEYLGQFSGEKKSIFCLSLLKLDSRTMIPIISGLYPVLSFQRKMLMFDNLLPEDFMHYADFVHALLDKEPNETLLTRVIEILVKGKDFGYIFQVLDSQQGRRKEKFLDMVLEQDPPGLETYLRHYVSPSQNNRILALTLEYLLRHAADDYFDLIKGIFFSGVTVDIKVLIIRGVNKWNGLHQKIFMEEVFKDLVTINSFKKDFLFALLGVMNEKVFDMVFEEQILNRILIMMEEAAVEDIINFLYFFEHYETRDPKDSHLIVEELRLIQNTLLKSGGNDDLVRMIHVLNKKIERKVKLNLS